jgi:uncharacterized protein (UPF0332 family)
MKPREFLDVADDLSMGLREADWRSAVSRAYYAAFHTARLFLQQCGFDVPLADQAHAYLWLRLSNSGHPDVQTTGTSLARLRQMRNTADYNLDHSLEQSIAMDYVVAAEKVVELLESVPALPHVATGITEAIKNYERDVLRQVTWHG